VHKDHKDFRGSKAIPAQQDLKVHRDNRDPKGLQGHRDHKAPRVQQEQQVVLDKLDHKGLKAQQEQLVQPVRTAIPYGAERLTPQTPPLSLTLQLIFQDRMATFTSIPQTTQYLAPGLKVNGRPSALL
jgi:hypothetical protein